MVRGIGKTITKFIHLLIILVCVFVPLGIWKLIDIINWLVQNVKF